MLPLSLASGNLEASLVRIPHQTSAHVAGIFPCSLSVGGNVSTGSYYLKREIKQEERGEEEEIGNGGGVQ